MENENTAAVAEPFDLSATVFEDTVDQRMVVPGSEPPRPTGWVVTHAGPGHPKSIALNDRLLREYNERELDKERARTNGKKWKGDEKNVTDQRREFVEGIVARIVGWTPVTLDGKRYEFSEKVAVELLLQPKMGGYVAQMREFQGEEKSFMKGSGNG